MHLKLIENEPIETMGVDNFGNLYYNSKWVNKLSEDEMVATLSHEVMHVALEHLNRGSGKNKQLFNISSDLVINSILYDEGMRLPKDVLVPKKGKYNIFGVKLNNLSSKTSEEVYYKLHGKLLKEFFTKYGSQEKITRQTASPALGFLNAGLQLFWLKYRKPELFKQIKYSLHFPQYLSYLFTGKTYSEITSIGCHTTLWDFEKQHPHDWVYKEKLMSLFPPLINTFNTVKIRYKSRQIPCGIGVHDSSAALIPYQLRFEEPFILVSTGTWSITLNPYSDEPLTFEELNRDCLSYINYKNQPVRASRLFLGKEHSYQRDRIAAHFRKDKEYNNSLKFDPDLIRKLIRENNKYKKFFPEMMVGTGPYPKRFIQKADLKLFDNFEEAYHQLMLDLISMQATSIELARGNSKIKKIFLAGRFCRNEIFVKLLASRFPEIEVYTPEHSSVTPLGAAITMHASWNHEKDLQEVLRFTKWEPVPGLNLKLYKLVD